MKLHEEKRLYQRYEHDSPIHLYRMDYQDQHYNAEMYDYSQGGMSLLTKEKLVVGHFVYLEMKNHDQNATGPEKQRKYSGSVKWARPSSSNGDGKGAYKYGIEYSKAVGYQC